MLKSLGKPILVEIFAKPLKKRENALCFVWFCHFTPGHGFWSFPIFAHYSALQYVVQGNLWIYWFYKGPFWLLKFPWTVSEGLIKNSFLNLLKRFYKTKPKRFFIEPKLVQNHILRLISEKIVIFIFYFLNFFCSLRILLRGQL